MGNVIENASDAFFNRRTKAGPAGPSDGAQETVAGGATGGRLFRPSNLPIEAFLKAKLASGLDGLAKRGGRGLDVENVTHECVLRGVIDKGEKPDVLTNAHEGKISNSAFGQRFTFALAKFGFRYDNLR